jgi:hypothetical protein
MRAIFFFFCSWSFSGARGPQFTPSDRDAFGDQEAEDQSGVDVNAESGAPAGGNQRGPQYVVLDRRR